MKIIASMSDEKTICGIELGQIRRSYFAGRLGKLLNSMMESGTPTEKEVMRLGKFLEGLRKEGQDFAQSLREKFGSELLGEEPEPPTIEELLEEGISDEEWRKNADEAAKYVQEKMDEARQNVAKRLRVHASYWLDLAVIINSYQGVLDRDRVYKDTIYRARLTRIMTENKISNRKEAEEYARMTPEYSDYKNAVLLRERIDEFIKLCKRKDGDNQIN